MFKDFIKKICIYIIDKLNDDKKCNSLRTNDNVYNKVHTSRIIFKHNKKCSINKEFVFFNIGNLNLPYIKTCVNSYKQNNPDFDIKYLNFSYNDFFKHEFTWKIVQECKFDNKKVLTKEELDIVIKKFKYKWIYSYGGICCSTKTYCVRNFDFLYGLDNFIFSSSRNGNVYTDESVFGVSKGYVNNLNHIIYPPMNYDDFNYESIKMSFYRGSLRREMFRFKNLKLQAYCYNFGD